MRVFDAPRELVFRMWTDPEHLRLWWGPHGCEIPFSGEFTAVDPPRHLEMTLADPGNPRSTNRERFTVDLRELGDGRTEMTFTQTGGNLPADEYSRAMRGMLIFLERQAAHLADVQAAA